MDTGNYIAERRLFFAAHGDDDHRKELIIRVNAPRLVEEGSVDFQFDQGTASCSVSFEGLRVLNADVYGMDTLQALTLASDIDPILRGLQKKHGITFYWPDGDTYFD